MARLAKKPRPKAFGAKHLHGWTPWSEIVNKDPTRFYVLANKTLEGAGSVEYYESIGYEVERVRKGGPRFAAGKPESSKEGDVVAARELVLMSIPRHSDDENVMTHELIEKFGPHGVTGQDRYDAIMAHLANKGPDGFNPLRNTNLGVSAAGTPYFSAENETSPLVISQDNIQR